MEGEERGRKVRGGKGRKAETGLSAIRANFLPTPLNRPTAQKIDGSILVCYVSNVFYAVLKRNMNQ